MTSPAPALSLPRRQPQPAVRPAVIPPAEVIPRFTVDGGRELEQHLARTCDKIAAGIRGLVPRGRLEGILLGGGYGRGEGGVLRTPQGDRPYNDLEFYLCLRGNRHLNELRFGRALHVLGEILTPQAGVEVEFRITSRDELGRGVTTMFAYDLVSGHRQLGGAADLLAGCDHHRDATRIPLVEATRLMMNRCSGLLFARQKLAKPEFTAADADFVQRNIAKAQLAFGDAWLVTHALYHHSARERHQRLLRIAENEPGEWLHDMIEHHAAGLEFKLHPERSTASRDTLQVLHARIAPFAERLWLRLEARRLCASFASAGDYAQSPVDKCPETSPARNVLVNAKVLRTCGHRHPRERVLHALTLLLWEPATLTTPALLARVQRELRTSASTFADLVAAYRELWAKVN